MRTAAPFLAIALAACTPPTDPSWTVVRPEKGGWTSDGKVVQIRTLPGSLWEKSNDVKNLLLRAVPSEATSVSVEARVSSQPATPAEQAGLVLYGDDDHYVKLVREFMDGKTWGVMAAEESGRPRAVGQVESPGEGCGFRLVRSGSRVTGLMLDSSGDWKVVGQCDSNLPVARAGLAANGGAADARRWARFEGFETRTLVVPKEEHLGKEAVKVERAGVRVVALPPVGGRVVSYGLGEENILWPSPDAAGKPRPGGGSQMDIGPEMRQLPPHPAIWSGAYRWAPLGDGFTLWSERDPALGLQVSKTALFRQDGSIDWDYRMENVSDQSQAYCFWDRTLCEPGGFALIPLNPKSRFPARWVLGKRLSPSKWEYNGRDPAHPQIKVMDDVLVARTGGPEQKIGADSDGRWLAYAKGRLAFVKYYPYFPEGNYTDGGLSVAFYFSDRLSEMEPISPEMPLKPRQAYSFPERWLLLRLDREVTTHEEARALVGKITPSPFAR